MEDRQYDDKLKPIDYCGYMFIGLAMRWSETTIVLFVYLFMSISRRSRHVAGGFPVYDMCTAEIWNNKKVCV